MFELHDQDIKQLTAGQVPDDFYFRKCIEDLIKEYPFMKTTHKSAHAFKPIKSFEDFEDQILNASVIMSFRRYHCKYLLFRQWTEMNLECRVYVYQKQVKYIEVYRDEKNEFKPEMFQDIFRFVQDQVVPKLSIYESFTADVFYKNSNHDSQWGVVEINSPFWLKCGTYLIKYDWEKHRIHETTAPICRYTDPETKEVVEL